MKRERLKSKIECEVFGEYELTQDVAYDADECLCEFNLMLESVAPKSKSCFW